MKVVFICDWDFTLLWEKVAVQLKQEGVVDAALAIVVGRNFKEHLEKSRSNPFDKEWLLQDVMAAAPNEIPVDFKRLRELEQKYANPTLWRYLWADRSWTKETFEASCSKLIKAFDFYEELYSRERPGLVLSSGYGSMPHLVSHFVARGMGIPMLYPVHARIADGYLPGYDALERFDSNFEATITDESLLKDFDSEIEAMLTQFRKRPERPAYETVNDRMHRVGWGHLFRLFRYVYRYWVSGSYARDHSKPNPLKKIWLELRPKIRRKLLNKSNIWEPFNPSIDYVYFPLHLQPEYSTMALAPFYLDQPSIIENLAKSVPIGYRVVVKEHPQMLGRRPKEYYECLKAVCNVVVIPPFTDNFSVINNSKLIFTITGTAGMEGLILGKPVVTLGSVIYNHCHLVKYAGDVAPTQWSALINDLLLNYSFDESKLLSYLRQVYSSIVKFWFVEPLAAPDEMLSYENINNISNWVKDEVDKIVNIPSYGRPPFSPVGTIWDDCPENIKINSVL